MATVLPNLSHHNVSLSQRVRTQRPETRRPRDSLSKERIIQETHCPRDGRPETFRSGTHRLGTKITFHHTFYDPRYSCREEVGSSVNMGCIVSPWALGSDVYCTQRSGLNKQSLCSSIHHPVPRLHPYIPLHPSFSRLYSYIGVFHLFQSIVQQSSNIC
jgi:hypothetical protein